MGTGVGEAMLIGAITGAGTSAVTGGDPLKGALFGAVGGGVTSGLGGALGGQAAGTTSALTSAAPSAATTAAATAPTAAASAIPSTGGLGLNATSSGLGLNAANAGTSTLGANIGSTLDPYSLTSNLIPDSVSNAIPSTVPTPTPSSPPIPKTGFLDIFKGSGATDQRDFTKRLGDYLIQNPSQAAMGGGALTTALMTPRRGLPDEDKYSGPLSRFRYDPRYYYPAYAEGGITDLPVSKKYAAGGDLGGYSDGGRMLKGPGDGMSDSIPAQIGRRQPARLADGEFVVPADVVSHLGNGSTDAGAKQLYSMMDKVRKARTGNKKQGREINPRKYMPA